MPHASLCASRRPAGLLLLVASLAVASSVARAQTTDSIFYGISKELAYTQNSAAAPVLNASNPALFEVSLPNEVAGSFRTPAGVTTAVPAGDSFQRRFATRAAMDTAYPDGTYTLTIGSTNVSLAAGSASYPSEPPQVLNGTWTQGRLVIDPTRDVTIQFNPTAGWGRSSGGISYAYFSLWEGDGDDIISVNRISTEAAGPIDTLTIPARTLVAGRVYNVEVYRYHANVFDRTSIPGAYGHTGNAYQTTFQISAVAPANSGPVIAAQPASKTIAVGSTVVFSVDANGAPAPTYQWRRGTTPMTGETRPTLVLSGAAASAGNYNCVVTNSGGTVTTTDAVLTVSNVAVTDVGRLANLSVLAPTGPGAQLLTMGATVGGQGVTGAVPLVIRGIGPTLGTAPFNIGGVLADPTIAIAPAGTATPSSTNDNWGNTPALVAAFAGVGAFALPATSLDSAALQNQAAGGFTVQVAGKGNATGLVLAEVYDGAGTTRTATTPRLTNLSTLTSIAPGGTLTAGFVVGGSTARTVLVRGAGPTLETAFKLSGVLADPKLELFNNDTGAKIGENDNWTGSAWLINAGTSVGAFAFGGATTKDPALLVTLAPGAYSARVSGVNGIGGTTIIEVYEVP